ncbi:MAG: hypothetical protein Q4D02_08465 [Clostridia bacterium]|nr:hypothetical protein [Clostridia bacterium]
MPRHKKRTLLLTFLFIFIICIVVIFSIYSKSEEKVRNEDLKQNVEVNKTNDIYSSCLPEDKIYATAYIYPEAEFDLTNSSLIYDNSDLVIVGNITEKKPGKMLEELGYPGLVGIMSIDTVIKGDFASNEIEFFTSGGYCTIKEYIDVISKTQKERIDRLGFSKLTDEEKENNYLVFNYEYGKNFDENKRYILMLKNINGKYICLSNYGFIEVSQEISIKDLSDILNISE